ncbi:uncharacterized protein SPAPADRAFT_149659 [Spathaspora passalidarum NRRL Y-27907]|uniref:SWR1-complex protein 4 n=1 Tax=Spathaspora passalidarum (strain NRRL Y-27907 / 11-Y1) TaxID=619300 RepID=G3AJB3_SPAPN|nr:uncharacterized protein SPAPADRAFT_149659 [Spathaspora passalidarum NRRL Y-27907]EGW34572.1 hypothetical protein SPAPADRAFT_149659 [Spathaspora passalidarum NRRL Y-27907]
MSANDILDVLNISRDEPPKKKQRNESTPQTQQPQLTGMARELYNLIGPNTPPLQLSSNNYTKTSIKDKINFKPSPWTKMEFNPKKRAREEDGLKLYHWTKGSKEFLESAEEVNKPYFFEKFNVNLSIPELVDEETYDKFMEEIQEHERKEKERKLLELKERERERQEKEKEKEKERQKAEAKKEEARKKQEAKEKEDQKKKDDKDKPEVVDIKKEDDKPEEKEKSDEKTEEDKADDQTEAREKSASKEQEAKQDEPIEDEELEWTYEETNYLFELCKAFELKWPIIYDRYNYNNVRTCEDLKEHFYRLCIKILQSKRDSSQSSLIESLKAYSKPREIERKQYLENLLKRTPAEIAEEESLVIEARRFELAAKKMLIERSNLLTLLDSPQSTQNSSQYQSSQGLANLYNNLMIFDKHQKKKQAQQLQLQQQKASEPIPPPIPMAASSSFKKDKVFQTHLQQYLSSLLKQNVHTNPAIKQEASAIQQMLSKRLTQKEEEAYGLHYHGNEKLTPGVVLRSTQKLPSLNQKQSTLKSVNQVLQELDIPTGGGTAWKPVMPTRKTMSRYDELIRTVVALLEVKKAKDKLESEINLIKSQRGML